MQKKKIIKSKASMCNLTRHDDSANDWVLYPKTFVWFTAFAFCSSKECGQSDGNDNEVEPAVFYSLPLPGALKLSGWIHQKHSLKFHSCWYLHRSFSSHLNGSKSLISCKSTSLSPFSFPSCWLESECIHKFTSVIWKWRQVCKIKTLIALISCLKSCPSATVSNAGHYT